MDNDKAVTQQVTSGTKVEAIGTVKTVVGVVKAVDPSGVERILQAGDKVYPNETIITAVGALVLIEFLNGTYLDLPSDSKIVLDTDVFNPEAVKGQELTAEQIQEMIAAGADPTAIAEATAAGAGAGDEGGSSFVIVDFNNTQGQVTSGYPTIGIPGPESITFTELPPVEEAEVVAPTVVPTIAVSVEVNVQIGGGEPGGNGIVLIPGGTPITGGVSGANVIEGSDGVAHQVSFLITLSQVATAPVTVTYTIIPVTASNPDDYFDGAQTATVTIPAGYIGFTVTENIVADILVEGNETFKIVLSDVVGATLLNDTAIVTIIDDDLNPVANDDTNWAQEDAAVIAAGNVLQTNPHAGDPSPILNFGDVADVDDNPITITWGGEAAAYGSIVKNADGTYTYTLNNANPTVQGLADGEILTEAFTYSITDGANPPDTGTLTITIFGADDGVTIQGIGAIGGDQTVNENDLPAGSSPSAGALTQAGSFDIQALDGIATVNVGGTILSVAQLQNAATFPVVIDTAYGALTLTGYSGAAQGGTVSYSYTLDSTVDNDSQPGAASGNYVESVAVTVTDEDGSFANSSVNINIIDDVPTASDDGTINVPEDTAVTFSVFGNDTFGADSVDTDNSPTAVVTFTAAANGSVSYNGATGQFTYTPNAGYAGPDSFTYTIQDGDSDPSTATVTLQVAEDSIPQVGETTSLTVDEDGFVVANDDTLTPRSDETDSTGSLTQSGAVVVNFGADVPVNLLASIALLDTGALDGQLQTLDGQNVTFALDGGDLVGTVSGGATEVIRLQIESAVAGPGAGEVTYAYSATLVQPVKHADGSVENTDILSGITFEVTDADANTAQGTFNVTVVDDVPSILVNAEASADALVVDESNLALNASANFADNFSNAPSFGADGAGTISSAYTLGINAGGTGLVDTATNQAVVLVLNGGVVEGRTAVSNDLVFTVAVDGSGTVTLDQARAVVHPTANPDEGKALSAADLIVLTRTDTITDRDGDTSTGSASINIGTALSFEDDGPSILVSAVASAGALVVDESNLALNASANFADNFSNAPSFGADGAGTISSAYTLGINAGGTGLVDTATNQAVVLVLNGGVVEGRTAVSNDLVFTVAVDGSGNVTLDQQRAVVHPTADPDEGKTLSAADLIVLTRTDTITDRDGDSSTGSASINIGTALSFEDDGPSILNKTDLIYANSSNPTSGGTGVFDYSIGADARTSYSSISSDFSAIMLTGMVGAAAISAQSVIWAAEDANTAVFNVQFSYAANPLTPDVLTEADGTLTFDKVNGTYTVALDEMIDSFSVLTTGGTLSKENYNLVGSSEAQPEIVVSKLADEFYVRFTGGEEQGGGGVEFKSSDGTTGFNNGETFVGAQAWVSISGGANGVSSDTLQAGEVLNMDFYISSPGSDGSPGAGTATADGIYLKLDQLGAGEDFVVILKLVDANNPAITTTKAIVVDYADIYLSSESNPYGVTFADGSDGVVIIESNDYNSGGSNWVINGAQLLVSTESVTGSGIDLNRATGDAGGSSGTETFGGDTVDNDVIKVSDIGFISTATGTQDASLSFQFTNVDADGDATATQTLNVTIEGGSTFVGTASAESIQGSDGNDILTGGAGSDIFVWSDGDTGTDTVTDFDAGPGGDVLNLEDLLIGESQTAASLAGGGYLSFSWDGNDTTITIDTNGSTAGGNAQTIVLEGVDLTAGNTLNANQIVTSLLADGNLKTDV